MVSTSGGSPGKRQRPCELFTSGIINLFDLVHDQKHINIFVLQAYGKKGFRLFTLRLYNSSNNYIPAAFCRCECYDYLFDMAVQMKQSGLDPSALPMEEKGIV